MAEIKRKSPPTFTKPEVEGLSCAILDGDFGPYAMLVAIDAKGNEIGRFTISLRESGGKAKLWGRWQTEKAGLAAKVARARQVIAEIDGQAEEDEKEESKEMAKPF